MQILEKSFILKGNSVPLKKKIYHLPKTDMYCFYQVIVVLKYNLRQLNINSCLLPYKNIYKNRVFKEVDIHTKELIDQNSLFLV